MTPDTPNNATGEQAAGEPVIEYLYVTIAKRILHAIHTTRLRPGERLPPMRQLAVGFGVSAGTVRHALKLLEQRDLTVRMRGRGTYVGNRAADLHAAAANGNKELFDLPAVGFAATPAPEGVAHQQ